MCRRASKHNKNKQQLVCQRQLLKCVDDRFEAWSELLAEADEDDAVEEGFNSELQASLAHTAAGCTAVQPVDGTPSNSRL